MVNQDACEVTIVHEDVVRKIRKELPDVTKMVQIFKALADETRLRIAYSLTLESEMCVCDVAAVIQSSSATASHHLRYLRDHSLAKSERRGKMVYYSLADEHVADLVKIAYEHAIEAKQTL
ncbi:ArsR family transcriptional regulator [Sporosarcina sp. P21c]|uniref:ArsR/SmtB family transcription factor n=1 Tax=Sporosarcina TaxID=1569 RepID=UPI000A1547E1|nr:MULTISPECIES: metalloregulator ArsR/SmtB family transcription factor [Sporosarcina]ARJ38710.1 transcriptional regulator [Sporosarcina ureae]PIC68454.1 ArsR family transcriptional regulator [Sporosarcina sp. P16a]PIC84280.1 ArsR family transcriptional regulator [Sporosarcina sp. P1]PIC88981.1 ArsR family transcriptional regulator [Sporosarcina sp. P21c]PIC92225.1 ArsR family transcriptional regulator [Sporosarcina sp. P25]